METCKLCKGVNENPRRFLPHSTAPCSLHNSPCLCLCLFSVRYLISSGIRYGDSPLPPKMKYWKKKILFICQLQCTALVHFLPKSSIAVQSLVTAEQQQLGGNLQVCSTAPQSASKGQGRMRTDCWGSPGLADGWAAERPGGKHLGNATTVLLGVVS